MIETFELLLLGFFGIAVHYTKEWAIHSKKGMMYDFKKSIPMAILSVMTTALLIYVRRDIQDIYVITKLGAAILGYMGNSVFFSFVDTKKPKFKDEN